jgi:cyclopropane fatty-acyl-phospholipid synthase-like methyltransferase
MSKVDYFINSYKYFCQLNQGPITGSVLDYGSNYGMFLESSENLFPENMYTGLDLDLEALQFGRKMFPNATFIHYDKHNFMYNPKGREKIWPDIINQFDCIISYSVITHTTKEDMLDTIAWLYTKLKPGRKMFITWLDQENKIALNYFYKKRIRDFGSCDTIQTADYLYLVDNNSTKIPSDGMFLAFYEKEYLANLLIDYDFSLEKSPDPSTGCVQDCIIIKKSG